MSTARAKAWQKHPHLNPAAPFRCVTMHCLIPSLCNCYHSVCAFLQAFKVFHRAGEQVMTAVTKSPALSIRTSAFSDIQDDSILASGQRSSSVLVIVHYLGTSTTSGGCHPHVDKGALTLISSDADGLQIRAHCEPTHILAKSALQHVCFASLYISLRPWEVTVQPCPRDTIVTLVL